MNNRGFTLLEMIVVVSIISVLSLTAYGYYQDSIATARDNVVRQNIQMVREALGRYFQMNLQYPVDLNSLTPSYLSQTVEKLLVEPIGNGSIEVEIPETTSTSPGGVNPLQHSGNFEWVSTGENAAKPNGPRQIRAVRVRDAGGQLIN